MTLIAEPIKSDKRRIDIAGTFVPVDETGIEVNHITAETRRELDPSQVDPVLFAGGVTTRILGDRNQRSVRADVVAYVHRELVWHDGVPFEYANAWDWRAANRDEVMKSLGLSHDLEIAVEIEALRNPGGSVLPLED